MSDSSIDDDSDISVQPGRWEPKHGKGKEKYLPAKWPSRARMAAQEIIEAQRQKDAAKALIVLFHSNPATSDNNDGSSSDTNHSPHTASHATTDTNNDDIGTVPDGAQLNNTVTNKPASPSGIVDNTDHRETDGSGTGTSTDPLEDNLPLSQVCDNLEDDLPLSILRDQNRKYVIT